MTFAIAILNFNGSILLKKFIPDKTFLADNNYNSNIQMNCCY